MQIHYPLMAIRGSWNLEILEARNVRQLMKAQINTQHLKLETWMIELKQKYM